MIRNLCLVETPLSPCVRTSGTLPISIQGHYDHWQKYNGRRDTVFEDGIKVHLKNLRIQRSYTQIKKRSHKDKRLPTLRTGRSKRTLSSSSGKHSDIFDMYNEMVDSGSTWWIGSPLPDIVDGNLDTGTEEVPIQQPFYISPDFERTSASICKPVRCIYDLNISELFPSKTLHLYVLSSNSDMTIERKHLEGTAWPYLRHLCLQYRRELIIHDLHTFSGELLSLGRGKYLDEIDRSLSLCTERNSEYIKAVILFGDYFDKKGPPETLSKKTMSTIKHKMQKDVNEIKIIQNRIQTLKVQQQQMKQNENRRDSSIESLFNREGSDADLKKGLKMNTDNDSFNSEISALGESIDLLTFKTNIAVIEQWYRQSEENIEVYFLQNEGDIIKELKTNDTNKVKQAKTQWNNIKDQLCFIISSYASDIMDQQKSLFDYEVKQLEKSINENQCFLITRTFNNNPRNEIVKSAKSDLISKFIESSQRRFELTASKEGFLTPKENWEHGSYLKHISANIQNVLEKNIVENIRKEERLLKERIKSFRVGSLRQNDIKTLFSEIQIQSYQINDKCASNYNLLPEIQEVVSQIENSVLTSDGKIILLASFPLSGKSSVISTFVRKYQMNLCGSDTIFLYRIIGCSYQSSNKIELLRSICLQICYEAGIDMEVPHEFMALKTMFYEMTLLIRFRVVMCIDGLDLLSDIGPDASASFDWLTIKNRLFTVILSCTVDSMAHRNILNLLQKSEEEYLIINIPELSTTTIEKMLNSFLRKENLHLTKDQIESINKNCQIIKTVGFVESNLRIIKFWTSTSSIPRLGSKFELNIHTFFGKLEDTYGEPIIRRLLGYITCFRDGCTVTEILDLMTMDDVVQRYLNATLDTKDFRYTFSLLRGALVSFEDLLQCYHDESGLSTLKWRGTLYLKTATERYLLQKDKAPSYHQLVSQYFMNDLSDLAIVEKIRDEDSKRPNYSNFLVKQELLFNDNFDSSVNQFNLRKMVQLPFHLIQSQNSKLAKLTCLFNFYWLQAITINFDCYKLVREISFANQAEPEDVEYPLLMTALELSKTSISRDSSQLISQLLGRLTDIVRCDVDSVEPQKYPHLEVLYKSLRRNKWLTSLIPSKSCMNTGEIVDTTTVGYHFGAVTSILLTESGTRLMTTTDSGTLYSWDVSKNQIITIVHGVGKNIFQMVLGNSNKTLITAMPELIEIWDLETEAVMKRIVMLYDSYCLTISYDRTVFGVFFYGVFWMASWNVQNADMIISKHIDVTTTGNCDGGIATANICRDFLALAAVKGNNQAILIDIKTGEINPKILKCKEIGSAISHVAMSSRYYILCSRGLSQKDFVSIIWYLELFDQEKLEWVRRISGCILDRVLSISVNSVGSHAVTLNSDNDANISTISIWNLETEEHKHSCEMPLVFDDAQCWDLSRVFLVNRRSNYVYKANTLLSKVKVAEKSKRCVVTKYPFNDRYVFVQSEDNAPVDVYNAVRNKTCARKVLRLPTLATANDIILLDKEKFIILSGKGYSASLPDFKEVFQTLKIYDLSLGRLTKDQQNVLIYPSRPSEYLILENDVLLGLSENRSNLVHWNLVTGQIEGHIRLNKELCDNGGLDNITTRRNTVDNQVRVGQSSLDRHTHESLVIDTILVSGDKTTLVAAYFTRFLCVFSLTEKCHKVNLTCDSLILHLQTAAITFNGRYVVQNNFNELSLRSFLTLWNTETGSLENSLPVSPNILAVTIASDSRLVGFVKENIGAFIWNTVNRDRGQFYQLPGSELLAAKTDDRGRQMEFIKNDSVLLYFTGRGFYFWNVYNDHCATIGSFEPDYHIQSFTLCNNDSLIGFLLQGSKELYTLNFVQEREKTCPIRPTYLKYFEKDNPADSDTEES